MSLHIHIHTAKARDTLHAEYKKVAHLAQIQKLVREYKALLITRGPLKEKENELNMAIEKALSPRK